MYTSKKYHNRRIALVDCNNFYASCERVFRPEWHNLPLGVLSNNDGCIVARSNELKEEGIPIGAPFFKYKNRLQAMNARIVSSNYALYGDMSARVMQTLDQFTPHLEIYSIDEAWLDFSQINTSTIETHAQRCTATVKRNTGIPVSMGIAPTKVLAKIANRICKKRKEPDGVLYLENVDSLSPLLETVSVGEIWGIGKRLARQLREQGIHTARQLRDAHHEKMRKQYSVVIERIILELRGIPCLANEDIKPRKQIIASRSFGKKVTELDILSEAVASHCARACEKLRAQHSECGGIQVSIRTSPFRTSDSQYSKSLTYTFHPHTADTRKIIQASKTCLQSIYKEGYRYAKAGVMLYDLRDATKTQTTFLGAVDSEQSRSLMNTLDRINRRYGKHTLFFATMGTKTKCHWQMKREHVSPCYTTRWSDLVTVK